MSQIAPLEPPPPGASRPAPPRPAAGAWVRQHGRAVSGVSTGGATLYEVSA